MLTNHISKTPLAEPSGFSYHYEKHYVDYGKLHYTDVRHFYAKTQHDLEAIIHFWDNTMDPDLSCSGDGDDEEEDEYWGDYTDGCYCTVPAWDNDDWNDSDDDYYTKLLAAQAAV